jgi:hypothetical protein
MVSSWGINNGDVVLKSDFQQGAMSSQSPQPVRETIIKGESVTVTQPSSAFPDANNNLEPLKEVQKNTYKVADRVAIDNASKVDESSEVEDDSSSSRVEIVEIVPPFPWLAMSALCLGMLAHSVVFTNPLPFVAFMVVDFKMADSVDSAGYYAGWITGTFMIGKLLFN